jgi:hypothetical protein
LDSADCNQWRPARHAQFCVISSQIPFAGDCGFDLRWVNDITCQRPRHSNRLFPGLIAGFHLVGLPILPSIDTLLVVNLDGTYAGEMLRLRGALRNVGSWSGHAAPLRVRVTQPDGVILHETIIRPDDRIIAANQQSPFFVKLDIDSGAKAEVSVIPISRPIFD